MTVSAPTPARMRTGTPQSGPIDIIMLTHDRLDHLVATLEALEARTPEPYRLTIVDNASGPELRNWLGRNDHRFERVILRAENEHVPAFQHGIDATLSDPYIVTDPDIIVPEGEPSWLARLLDLMERYPDFGLIGLGLDQRNRPPVLDPETIAPADVLHGELVETGVGTVFQLIRRGALLTPYRSDGEACTAVRRAGWRVGWAAGLRALHLGWDDYRIYPGHLARKGLDYGAYNEVRLMRRPPSLAQLATAAPVIAQARSMAIPDDGVLELAWGMPAIGAVLPDAISVQVNGTDPPELGGVCAAAVVLTDPPAGAGPRVVAEACRVASRAVIAVAPLGSFPGYTASELAPPGWTGRESEGPNDVVARLAAAGDDDAGLAVRLRATLLDDSDRWLGLFSAGGFGQGQRRLWTWERSAETSAPRVRFDTDSLERWHPAPLEPPAVRQPGPLRTAIGRLDLRRRAEVVAGRLRWRIRDGRRSRTDA